MSFKQYLTENKENAVHDCIAFLNQFAPRRAKHIALAETILLNAIKSDSIYNVQYKDARDFIGRALEDVLRELQDKEYYPIFWKYRDEKKININVALPDVSPYSPLTSCSGNIKKIDNFFKAEKNNPEYVEFIPYFQKIRDICVKFTPLNDLFKDLKGKIQKGRIPDPNAVPKFEPKFTAAEAKIILDKFKELTASIRAKHIIQQEKVLHKIVSDYQDAIKNIPRSDSFRAYANSKRSYYNVYKGEMQRNMTLRDFIKFDNTDEFAVIDNLNEKVTEVATNIIDDFHAKFIYKNVQKLSGVLARKDNLKEIRTIRLTSGAYTLEAELDFVFDDRAAFTVINKAVYGYSKTDKKFVRFPTTFHDVVLSDGTKMKLPNEEKMNLEFK